MSTRTYAAKDSATMLRRNLRHALRYPSMTVSVVGMPIIMLLLFVEVFGGAMSASLAGASNNGATYIDAVYINAAYINYLVPGILVMTVGSGSMPTAVAVCTDLTEGIIARFRTMAISRASILTGHVVGSMIQTMVSVGLVIGVSLILGFRPTADPVSWIAAIAVLALLALALTWLAVALGLVTKTPEAASNVVLPLFLLPFISSAFVPLDTMPGGVRWFAQYQPFGGCFQHQVRQASQRRSTVLTIGQLAAYVGVTVRAVRHYHQRGLLAEPARDGSGYRRYDADSVVDLIRIKTLSGAGVPLARIEELLNAEPEQFCEAIAQIDESLTAKIRELTDHRRSLAGLDGGESLFLPAEFVEYLDQLRAFGVSARTVQLERNGWILLVAGSPRQATELLRQKRADLQDTEFRALYLAYDQSFDWDPTDPRLEELANTVVSFVGHRPEETSQVQPTPKSEADPTAIAMALLSSDIGNSSPSWDRLTEMCRDKLEARLS